MYYHKQFVRALEALIQQGKVTDEGGLNISVSAFSYWRNNSGVISLVTAAAIGTTALADNTTNYVYVTESSATIAVKTSALAAGEFPLATIVTLSGDITSITDNRSLFCLPEDLDLLNLSAKGSILTHNGATETELALGTNGYVLTADSTQPNGIKWNPAGTPGSHAASHRSTGGDAIALADGSASGLLTTISGVATEFLNGQHAFSVPPTVTSSAPGYVPTHPNTNTQALLGDASWGLPNRPLLSARGTADATGGLITWTTDINEGTFTINANTTINFPSNGTYMVEVKLLRNTGVATAVEIQKNGSQVDQSSSSNSGNDVIHCKIPVVISTFATDTVRVVVTSGSVNFSAPIYNRLIITKYK